MPPRCTRVRVKESEDGGRTTRKGVRDYSGHMCCSSTMMYFTLFVIEDESM